MASAHPHGTALAVPSAQATLILMAFAFLKSHGKEEEEGTEDQHGCFRAQRHLLAASSDSLSSKLAAPAPVPSFWVSRKPPAWVISDPL